jgi:cation:H+ antiporter
MLLDIIIILGCVVGLGYGATLIVESAARMSRKMGVSELVIGLTVVAFGTSAPEFAVTIAATLKGQADISVSNIVGSNIFNLGFILGSVIIVRSIQTNRKLVYRDGLVLIGATFILLFFMRDLTLQRYEGFIMFGLLILYVGYLIYQREAPVEELPEGEFEWRDVPRFLAGIFLIVTSGHFLVDAAVDLALFFGISEWVIGVTIVAAGTSAPEMATSLIGVLRGHEGISLGNLIGSDLFNLLGVLGLAGIIQAGAMQIDPAGLNSLILLSFMVIVVVIMMRTGWRLSRWEGILLVSVNILRWVVDFTTAGSG